MITGIMFLGACIGVVVVVFWVVLNDSAGPTQPTKGILAMPEEGRPAAPEAGQASGAGAAAAARRSGRPGGRKNYRR